MKNWMYKKVITSNKGETIMESVVSLLALSFLLLSITVIINTSLRITGLSIQEADGVQQEINNTVILSVDDSKKTYITFSYTDPIKTGSISPGTITATHEIKLVNKNGIIAFDAVEAD